MALPRHPGDDDNTEIENAPSPRTKVIVALVVTLIAIVVVLHLTGVIGGN